MNDEKKDNGNRGIKKLLKCVLTFSIVGFTVVGVTIIEIDFSIFTSGWVTTALLIIVFLEAFSLILASLNYRKLVMSVSGIHIKRTDGILIYNLSNLYKYIPGGLMYFLGRNKLVFKTEGLTHTKVGLATLDSVKSFMEN